MATFIDISLEYVGQARLVERHPGVVQRLDLDFANFYPQRLVAEFRHVRRMCRAEVANTNHRQAR